MGIRRNVVANGISQFTATLLSVAFIPVYIHFLGIEAYGLVGVFSLLQAWLVLLDLGLAPALSREMARFAGGARDASSIHQLLRSVELTTIATAAFVVLSVALASGWLSTRWLHVSELTTTDVAVSLTLMGVVIGLRLLENIYRSSLFGLERQVLASAATAVLAAGRWAGAAAVVAWLSPTVHAFFVWQAAVSGVAVIIFAALLYRTLGADSLAVRPSIATLRQIGPFAGGALLLTVSGTLLSQSDKLILASVVSLSAFAAYSVAYALAAGVRLLVQPVDVAVYPRLIRMHSRGEFGSLSELYHRTAQFNAVLLGGAGAFLAVFGEEILALWIQDSAVALDTLPVLRILVVAMILNGFMNGPYYLQLAAGWTGLLVKGNWALLAVFLPATYLMAMRFGPTGAALVWLALNLVYVFGITQLMHRRLLPGELRRWYVSDLVPPVAASLIAALILRLLLAPSWDALQTVLFLVLAFGIVMGVSSVAAPRVRRAAIRWVSRQ